MSTKGFKFFTVSIPSLGYGWVNVRQVDAWTDKGDLADWLAASYLF
jgi:hypothetical protein